MNSARARTQKSLSWSSAIFAALGILGASQTPALAQEDSSTPKLNRPIYPKEPNKRPAAPVDPSKFVEAPDEPPNELSGEKPLRIYPKADQWAAQIDFGWFYQSQSSKHSYSSNAVTLNSPWSEKRNSNPLSVEGRFETAFPKIPIALELKAAATMGRAQLVAPNLGALALTADVQDFRGSAAIDVRPTGRNWRHDLRIGANVEYAYESDATLVTPNADGLTVDARKLVIVEPRLQYRYAPRPNWSAEFLGAYGLPASTQGSGDSKAQNYRKIVGELRFVRYIAAGNAFGIGGRYFNEKATWSQTAPFSYSDDTVTTDVRLNLFWRVNL